MVMRALKYQRLGWWMRFGHPHYAGNLTHLQN
jgi:hypothetical protein